MKRALVPALAAAMLAGPALADRTVALVIGIDEYAHIPGLSGAVNDARDIADALTALGAETTLLLNAEANREAILSTWTRLATEVGPGDRLIITYAGHGSNEIAAIPGEEDDGRDENWLLSGFSPFGEASGERIRDNEIAALIALSPAAEVIFLSDSCHSGTVAREIVPVLGYRYYRTDGTLADDPLPPPPPRPGEAGEFDAVALYLGAVPDSERVPEFLIDNSPRGALSWSFAEGLRGAADTDGDGVISAPELETHVRARVREISRGLQRPQITAAGAPAFVLTPAAVVTEPEVEEPETTEPDTPVEDPEVIEAAPPEVEVIAEPPVEEPPVEEPEIVAEVEESATEETPDPFLQPFASLPPVTLSTTAEFALTQPEGSQILPPGMVADLVLDPATGELRTMIGDLLTTLPTVSDPSFAGKLQAAVDNARLAHVLTILGRDAAHDVGFAEGDGTYRDGDPVTVQVRGRQTRHVALFSLSPDGSIVPLYPLHYPPAGINDPAETDPAAPLDIGLRVSTPYGSDFLIAIETAAPSAALGMLLSDPTRTWPARTLWEALQMAAFEGSTPQIAIFPFHSRGP